MGFFLNYKLTTKLIIKILIIKIIGFEEEEEKSSHYGLYILGFTCATKVNTKRCDGVN